MLAELKKETSTKTKKERKAGNTSGGDAPQAVVAKEFEVVGISKADMAALNAAVAMADEINKTRYSKEA